MKALTLAIAAAAMLALPASAAAINTADLGVSISDSPDPVADGADLTYTVLVLNHGPGAATNVTLGTTTPPGTAFVSYSFPGGGWSITQTPTAGSSGIFSATNSSFAGRTGAIFDIYVKASGAGPFTFTASVQSDTSDPVPGNENDTEITNQPLPTPALAMTPAASPTATTPTKKCKKRRATAAKKKRCKKKR